MGKKRDLRNEPTFLWVINLWKKEARIYDGEKRASSINGVGKTIQLHAKESNWITLLK